MSAPPAVLCAIPPHVPRLPPNRPFIASIMPAAPAAGGFAMAWTPPPNPPPEASHACWFQTVPFRLDSIFEKPAFVNML